MKKFSTQPYWIDEGLLPQGSMIVVGGPPKSYKSFILNTIIVHCINGGSLFGAHSKRAGATRDRFKCKGGAKILLVEQEVGEYDLQQRFRELLATLSPEEAKRLGDNLIVESCNHDLQLDTDLGVGKISKIIGEFQPDIVIFDPIIEFHTADENDAQEMTKVMRNIDFLREKHKITVILVHHTKKQSADSNAPLTPDRLRGSSILYGKGDTFLMLAVNNPSAAIVCIHTTLRRGKPIKPFFVQLNPKTLRFEWVGWKAPAKPKPVVPDDDE